MRQPSGPAVKRHRPVGIEAGLTKPRAAHLHPAVGPLDRQAARQHDHAERVIDNCAAGVVGNRSFIGMARQIPIEGEDEPLGPEGFDPVHALALPELSLWALTLWAPSSVRILKWRASRSGRAFMVSQ